MEFFVEKKTGLPALGNPVLFYFGLNLTISGLQPCLHPKASCFRPKSYNFGPAATRALPASLPSYFLKFLMKRAARSLAFSSHSSRF